MKIRLLVIALILLCGGGIFLARSSSNRKFVDEAIDNLQWSKDSKALFYSKSQNKLFRYDVGTGKKQTFDMPDRLVEFDISPDGRFVIFPMVKNKTYGIYTMELDTNKVQEVFIIKNAVREYQYGTDSSGKPEKSLEFLQRVTDISWLPQNDVLLVMDVGRGVKDIRVLDRDRGRLNTIRSDVVYYSGVSTDGDLLLYEDLSKTIHLYNLRTKTDKRLDFGHQITDTSSMSFIYLSGSQLVFTHDKPKSKAGSLDLTTMQIRPIDLPEDGSIASISGNLSMCLTGSSSHPSAFHGGWVSNKVYVMDLPEQTVQQLRYLEQKPLPADASKTK